MRIVIKRDESCQPYDFDKVKNAVKKAFNSVEQEVPTKFFEQIDTAINSLQQDEMTVEEIQDIIQKELIKRNKYDVVESFILYRKKRDEIREKKLGLILEVQKKLNASDVQNQNANVDEYSFGGRIGEAARVVCKNDALKHVMSKKSRKNHESNEIYIHDLDSYSAGEHNCLTIPIDDLLAKGFKTRQVDIRPAGSVNTAMQLVAVIFQIQSLQQFGGVSCSHIDWTMVPYVRKSFRKHYLSEHIKSLDDFYYLDILSLKYDEFNHWVTNKITDFYIAHPDLEDDDVWKFANYQLFNGKLYQMALFETKKETYQAVEGMYHNLNSLQSRSGNQLPFSSLNYGTCTEPEGRMVTKALLEVSIEGLGPNHTTSIFPCGIFQYMKGVNDKPGTPNYDLKRLALKSTASRIYPNYANVDWSGNAGYDRNDPRTYFSTMGCHAPGTKIIMSDGTYRNVEDIAVGDSVMGWDGTPRKVLSLINGHDRMFKVSQLMDDDYIVNEGHVLALMYNGKTKYKGFKNGDKVEMTVHDYLELPYSKRPYFNGYKGTYDLSEKEFDVDPKELGLFIGGYSDAPDGIEERRIPEMYQYGSRRQRSRLIAGVFNSSTNEKRTICFEDADEELVLEVKRIASSLGYSCAFRKSENGTYRVKIKAFCESFDHEPNRMCGITDIDIEEVGDGDFYGFELDGDRLYLINDCTVTHNCRTANGWDINGFGQLKDGRGNICPTTIILPTLAMEVIEKKFKSVTSEYAEMVRLAHENSDEVVKSFLTYLDKKIHEAKDMLIERFNHIASQPATSASFMYENNTMAGYIPEEGIVSALRHGTLAIGELALAETLEILIGTNHVHEEGMELAKKIEGLFAKRCKEFKEEYKLNFGVYYTPAENLCYTAMKKFRKKYGILKNISEREYFTNSIHVPVWEHVTSFEKIDIESQLTSYSSAGCITYVELPDGTKNNIDAMETLVDYAMDKDIPYFAINIPLDTCMECGYTGEFDECPKCHSHKIKRLRRITGYLSSDVNHFNPGKKVEESERVKHTDRQISEEDCL